MNCADIDDHDLMLCYAEVRDPVARVFEAPPLHPLPPSFSSLNERLLVEAGRLIMRRENLTDADPLRRQKLKYPIDCVLGRILSKSSKNFAPVRGPNRVQKTNDFEVFEAVRKASSGGRSHLHWLH